MSVVRDRVPIGDKAYEDSHLVFVECCVFQTFQKVGVLLLICRVDTHCSPLKNAPVYTANRVELPVVAGESNTHDMACMPSVRTEGRVIRYNRVRKKLDKREVVSRGQETCASHPVSGLFLVGTSWLPWERCLAGAAALVLLVDRCAGFGAAYCVDVSSCSTSKWCSRGHF